MNVVIVDDHSVVRLGLRAVLESASNINVINEFSTPEEALPWIRAHELDLVLMDLRFKTDPETKLATTKMDGIDAVRNIRKFNGPPVIVVTAYGSEPEILAALAAGATGYVLKDAQPEELLRAVKAATRGEHFLAPRIKDRLDHTDNPALTEREYEVLRLVSSGKTNVVIAKELFLSQATIKTHLTRIFDKLGVRTRTAAVAAAKKSGLLED